MSGKGNGFGSSARYQSTGSRDPIWTRVSGDPGNEASTDGRRSTDEKVSVVYFDSIFGPHVETFCR